MSVSVVFFLTEGIYKFNIFIYMFICVFICGYVAPKRTYLFLGFLIFQGKKEPL